MAQQERSRELPARYTSLNLLPRSWSLTMTRSATLSVGCLALLLWTDTSPLAAQSVADPKATLQAIGTTKGLCVVLGDAPAALALAKGSELLVYVQSPDVKQVEELRQSADAAG